MTYASIALISFISPLVMVMSLPFVQEDTEVRVWGLTQQQQRIYNQQMDDYWMHNPDDDGTGAPMPPIDKCEWVTRIDKLTRTDRVWWMLVPNPFVIVADAAPQSPTSNTYLSDPLSAIRDLIREVAQGPELEKDDCIYLYSWNPAYRVVYEDDGTITVTTHDGTKVNIPQSPVKPRPSLEMSPVWPWGLGVLTVIGVAFFYLGVRQLRIPYRSLAKGTRVA
jgi:hypothetical protein